MAFGHLHYRALIKSRLRIVGWCADTIDQSDAIHAAKKYDGEENCTARRALSSCSKKRCKKAGKDQQNPEGELQTVYQVRGVIDRLI